MNNKKHVKSKTAPRQHLNNNRHIKSKTDSPLKIKVETFVPKPTQKFVKAIYKVKCPVIEKVNVVKTKAASDAKVRVETFVPKSKIEIFYGCLQGEMSSR